MPILQYAKSLPNYKDKCRLDGDKLIINGVRFGIEDISKLPGDLAVYKAVEKTDVETITFHNELSPYSNFHRSPFTINNKMFNSAEQWIQYQRCLMFGDSYTANMILRTETPLDAKRLSHRINGVDHSKWQLNRHTVCLDGVKIIFGKIHQ